MDEDRDDDGLWRRSGEALTEAGSHERRMATVGLVCSVLVLAAGLVFVLLAAAPLLGERAEAVVTDRVVAPDRGPLWVRFSDEEGRVVQGSARGRRNAATVTVWYSADEPEAFTDLREILVNLGIAMALAVGGTALATPLWRARRRLAALEDRIARDLHPEHRQRATFTCEVRARHSTHGGSWGTVLLYDSHAANRWRFKSRLTQALEPTERVTVTVRGQLRPYGLAVVEFDDGRLVPLPEGLLPPWHQRLRLLLTRDGGNG